MTSPKSDPASVRLFYSYSHKDEALREELEKHLSLLKRQNILHDWHDRQISAGREWEGAINENLEAADIILLLVSSDFLASSYCYDKEMTRALEKHEAGEACVIPLIVRPVYWSGAPFSKLQALPTDGKPVTIWPNRDEAWTDVTKGIARAIEELRTGPATPSSAHGRSRGEGPWWKVPYPHNLYFTGREKVFQQLHDALISRGTAALSGLGGIGKTQTAIEFAYRHRAYYTAVLWVKADPQEALVSDFGAIAELLNLPGKGAKDQNLVVSVVQHWLEGSSNWLLILDNADDLAKVRKFLPTEGKGHILLTTRAQAVGALAQRVEIEEMQPEEGALFLLRRAKILTENATLDAASAADRTLAEALAKEMDGLPLALDQAGAFIEETPSSLAEYLALYRQEGAKLRAERGELTTEHPSVTVTFSLASKQVADSSSAAADLLRVCTFLAPDAIPEELFTEGAANLGENLGPVAASPLAFTKAIKEAGRFSLIERNPANQTLDIHRLVQEVLKDEMDEAEQRQWAERVVRAINRTFPNVEFSTWQRCERLLPHAQACAELVEKWGLEFPEAARLLNQAGFYLKERARYAEAEPLYRRALAIREKVLGPEHPDAAMSLNNLAGLYRIQGQYAQAESLYTRALAIAEKTWGLDHPSPVPYETHEDKDDWESKGS